MAVDKAKVAEAEAQRNARLKAEGKLQESGWDKLKAGVGDVATGAANAIKNGWNFTPGFYDDLDKMMNGLYPNTHAAKAATGDAIARDFSNQAARRNMEAQAHQRQANYNPYERAGEIAAMKDEDQNRRQMSATNFAAGTGGTLARTTNAMDVEKQQDIANQERSRADQSRQQADTATATATSQQGLADQFRTQSHDYRTNRDESWRRSMGEGTENDSKTKKQTTVIEEKTKNPEDKEETPEEPSAPEASPGNYQAAYNYITHGNNPDSNRWNKGMDPNYEIGKKTAEYYGLQPVKAESYPNDEGSMQAIVNGIMSGNPNWERFMSDYNSATGRGVDYKSASNIDYNKQANVNVNGYTRDQLERDSQIDNLAGM